MSHPSTEQGTDGIEGHINITFQPLHSNMQPPAALTVPGTAPESPLMSDAAAMLLSSFNDSAYSDSPAPPPSSLPQRNQMATTCDEQQPQLPFMTETSHIQEEYHQSDYLMGTQHKISDLLQENSTVPSQPTASCSLAPQPMRIITTQTPLWPQYAQRGHFQAQAQTLNAQEPPPLPLPLPCANPYYHISPPPLQTTFTHSTFSPSYNIAPQISPTPLTTSSFTSVSSTPVTSLVLTPAILSVAFTPRSLPSSSSSAPARKKHARTVQDVADPWLCYLCNRRLVNKNSVQRHLNEVHGIEKCDVVHDRIKTYNMRKTEILASGLGWETAKVEEELKEIIWGVVNVEKVKIRKNDGTNRKMGGAMKAATEELGRMRMWNDYGHGEEEVGQLQNLGALKDRPIEDKGVLAVIAQVALEVGEGVEARARRDRKVAEQAWYSAQAGMSVGVGLGTGASASLDESVVEKSKVVDEDEEEKTNGRKRKIVPGTEEASRDALVQEAWLAYEKKNRETDKKKDNGAEEQEAKEFQHKTEGR